VIQSDSKLKKIVLTGCLIGFACGAVAQDMSQAFAPDQIKKGSAMYAQHCAPCHGPRMADPEGAFDLRKFPRDQHARFVTSVSKGKNSMPPWGELLKPEDIEALWSYVVAGESK
jgi:mono/diheme cytochrome c family protein